MANNFPLILDQVSQKIKELPSGDNLDLTGSDISAVQNILPETTETYDLGSTTLKWRDLYLSGNSIFIGNGSISLAGGVFTFTDENDETLTFSTDGTQFTNVTANTITADFFVGDGSQVDNVDAITLEGSDKVYFENYAETFANSAYANAITYTDNQITALVNSAPGVLDTLNELASAINDDENFAVTITNQISNAYSNAVSYTDGEISTLYTNVTSYADDGDAETYANATAYADGVAGDAYANAVLYVDTEIGNLVNSAPGVLDTLNELAEAIGDDDNFFVTVNNNINTAYSNAVSYTDGEISTLYTNVTSYADSGDDATYANATAYADGVADDAYSNAIAQIGNGTIEVANGSGLSGSGSFNVNDFTNTTITIQHADTSSVANVDNSGSTVLQDITFDEFGHVQSVSSANLTASDIPYSNSGTELSAGLIQTAVDELYDTKLDTSALTSSVTFFPTTANGDVAGYAKLVTSTSDSDFDSTAVNVSTGTFSGSDNLVGQLVSDAGVLEGSTTPINITTVGNVRRTSGNSNDSAEFYFEVYKRDSGGTETLIGTSNATRSVNVATYEEFLATALISDTLFTETDRVVLKFYASVVAGSGGRTYEFQYGGGQPVRSLFPVPVTVVPHINDAEDIIVDASGFSGILSGADDDVQAALSTIDLVTTDELTEGNTNLYFTESRVIETIETNTVNTISVGVTQQQTNTVTTSNTATLSQWSTIEYTSSKATISAFSNGERQVSEILITHNSSNAFSTEYGVLTTGNTLFTVDCSLANDDMIIEVTSISGDSTDFQIHETLFAVQDVLSGSDLQSGNSTVDLEDSSGTEDLNS